jgi:putative transposase
LFINMIQQIRKRTEPKDILYSLHLYFSELSLRNTSKAISRFVKRSHSAIRDWIQKYKPERLSYSKTQISEFIIDETQIKVGSELIWLWVVIESETKNILGISISKERNMFVVERFLSNIIENYGYHPVSTDGGTWYPQACRFLKLNHHLHSSYEKSVIIERTMQYIKDRTEGFDDYFPCRKKKCKLRHVKQWLNSCVNTKLHPLVKYLYLL